MNDSQSQSCTKQSSDPLQYWNDQYSNLLLLPTIAADYLSVTASSPPVEWLFGVQDRVFSPDRCLLTELTSSDAMST